MFTFGKLKTQFAQQQQLQQPPKWSESQQSSAKVSDKVPAKKEKEKKLPLPKSSPEKSKAKSTSDPFKADDKKSADDFISFDELFADDGEDAAEEVGASKGKVFEETKNHMGHIFYDVDPLDALLDLPQPIWVEDPRRYSRDLSIMYVCNCMSRLARSVVISYHGFFLCRDRFNQEVEDYIKYISPTEAEHAMRLLTVERIRKVITKLYPKAQVDIFGSFETKLYLPTRYVNYEKCQITVIKAYLYFQ
jgi:non-canonical poly(A) RNA polymerase PAPD5/7